MFQNDSHDLVWRQTQNFEGPRNTTKRNKRNLTLIGNIYKQRATSNILDLVFIQSQVCWSMVGAPQKKPVVAVVNCAGQQTAAIPHTQRAWVVELLQSTKGWSTVEDMLCWQKGRAAIRSRDLCQNGYAEQAQGQLYQLCKQCCHQHCLQYRKYHIRGFAW